MNSCFYGKKSFLPLKFFKFANVYFCRMEVAVKKDFRELSREEMLSLLQEWEEKKFRASQVYDWIWKKGAGTFDEMTNVSKELREKLNANFFIHSLRIDTQQQSSDGTLKFRFETFDHHFIEGVLIPTPHRLTACVSSQVGCSLSCAFCATGQMGRERNLEFDEIFDQVVLLNRASEKHFKKNLTNIVFMGMGEPLLNYANVMKAIDKITSPEGLGISPRRITVSTAGIAKMITKLGDDGVKFRLALSLHAATDEKRSAIMPINDSNNLEALIEALDYFFSKTHNRISFEYILLNGVNDSIDDARQLIKLCRRVPVKVNLIEYNRVANTPFHKTENDRALAFQEFLAQHNITATLRRSRGKDIDAACGQLANKG